VQKGEYPPESQ